MIVDLLVVFMMCAVANVMTWAAFFVGMSVGMGNKHSATGNLIAVTVFSVISVGIGMLVGVYLT